MMDAPLYFLNSSLGKGHLQGLTWAPQWGQTSEEGPADRLDVRRMFIAQFISQNLRAVADSNAFLIMGVIKGW